MTFKVKPDPKVEDSFRKLIKKDRAHFNQIQRKLKELETNPEIGKPLRNVLKKRWRLHIGPYVLTYYIDYTANIIRLIDYDHHDKIYGK
jgi:mRNA-degrading endonuclease RelE of RelBE toxin-antitoxin system